MHERIQKIRAEHPDFDKKLVDMFAAVYAKTYACSLWTVKNMSVILVLKMLQI